MKLIRDLRSKSQDEKKKILKWTVLATGLILLSFWLIKLKFELKTSAGLPEQTAKHWRQISEKFNILKGLFAK